MILLLKRVTTETACYSISGQVLDGGSCCSFPKVVEHLRVKLDFRANEHCYEMQDEHDTRVRAGHDKHGRFKI